MQIHDRRTHYSGCDVVKAHEVGRVKFQVDFAVLADVAAGRKKLEATGKYKVRLESRNKMRGFLGALGLPRDWQQCGSFTVSNTEGGRLKIRVVFDTGLPAEIKVGLLKVGDMPVKRSMNAPENI